VLEPGSLFVINESLDVSEHDGSYQFRRNGTSKCDRSVDRCVRATLQRVAH
jgi:hypothetical protein